MILDRGSTSSSLSSRQEKTQVRRQEILRAALSSFTDHGYERTTLAEIRRRSGASTGSIYHHFGGKAQLAAAVYLEGIIDYQSGLVAELERRLSARAGLKALVRYHLRWVGEHPDWARYLSRMRHADFMGPAELAIQERNRLFIQRIATWLRPHVAARRVKRLSPDILVSLLLGPAQEYARQFLSGRVATELSSAARILAEEAWRSLRRESKPRS